jgi:TonB family protein
MNRLQKKCLIATAGFHLLLIIILIVGPGFFTSKPKPDDTPLLDVIPSTAIEAALQSGVQAAQPPPPAPTPPQPVQPPTPIVTPPTPVQPPPPAPQPVTPAPSLVERVEHIFKPTPDPTPVDPTPDDSPKPADHKPAKPKPVKPKHEVKVDLTKVVTRPAQTDTAAQQAQTEAKREAQRQAARDAARSAAYQTAIRNLKSSFNSSTKVEMPGHSSVSYASYASIIKSIYTAKWIQPNNAVNDEANVKVSVTVDSDGNVVSSSILDPSGDPGVDASVQQTLNHVTFIAPFPEGATEKTKTFIINFNLKSKRMLG